MTAVSVMHQSGIVHRDIRPDNVVFGDDGVLRLGEFGLANFEGKVPFHGDKAQAAFMSEERLLSSGEVTRCNHAQV